MFNFKMSVVNGFRIHRSYQKQGDDHKKKFAEGVTPANQQTWNLYITGSFKFQIGDFEQTLSAGQTSLDLLITGFPADVVSTETVLSPVGVRYCVCPDVPMQWSKQVVDLGLNQSHSVDGMAAMVVLSGSVLVNGEARAAGAMVSVGPGVSIVGSASGAKVALAIKGNLPLFPTVAR